MARDMKVREIVDILLRLYPKALAQSWDNVGLLIGDPEASVRKVLVTIDITSAVLQEAKEAEAEMILSYHPVIWDGLKQITASGPTGLHYELIRSGIAVYSIHTCLDVIQGGINDALAQAIGLVYVEPLGDYVEDSAGPRYKVVTFVPVEHADKVADAMYKAGAGHIGPYSHCGFQVTGTGTFMPLEGARPAIGSIGRLERVQEVRLETVVKSEDLAAVIAAMRKAHPYQMPAFDVFRHYDPSARLGLGRLGRLAKPTPIGQILSRIKRTTGAKVAGIVNGRQRMISKAAVCAGACDRLFANAIAAGCQLYVTGELKHHQALACQEAGMTAVCLGHSVSERFALRPLVQGLGRALPSVEVVLSKKDADPFVWKRL
ncbi:MAG: Nif3-like dinuclear metal center hexameric protein [Sedimentisphaerales bacterium]|nr:Nif3-like dinuclear metal center hexameric protein [Sedimentisphaerales bacterium]